MYALESHKSWRIFKKVCSLVLILTFSSYVLPVRSAAADSTNYRLSNFVFTSSGEQTAGPTYRLSPNTFGEAVNGDLESAGHKTQSGFLHTIGLRSRMPSAPPEGTDRLAQSLEFRETAYLLSIAGSNASSATFDLTLASVGEPVGGFSESYYDKAFLGHIYTVSGNPPVLIQNIPAQSWQINASKDDAFDLDDYFIDPDGDELTFTVSGNTDITVTIDPTTHQVSFSPGAGFTGSEDIIITAIDAEGNRVSSHPITLNVYNTDPAVNNAPVLEYISSIAAKEGSLIEILASALDPDGDPIAYSFSAPFDSQGRWQTDYQSAGTYNITVTASDGALTDLQKVKITVLNVQRKPTLNYIAEINAAENELIVITPEATDPDNDDLTFSFSGPFNSQGQWLPGYFDSGARTITVTVSDGTLSDSREVLVNIADVNTIPAVTISLERINAQVDEEFSFIVEASDADYDTLNLTLKKDGSEFYSGSIYEFYVGTVSFPSLGTHSIEAIVDDGHGGQAETAVNVEIIEPKSLWNKILPLLGDFNGDGIVDIGTYNRDTGRWAVALSNASGFGSLTEWLNDFGASTDWQYVNGDFNGDGRTDIAIFNQSSGDWRVGTSSGVGFSDEGVWSTFSGASSNSIPITGDFNGDGVSDVGIYDKSNGEVNCAVSDKSKFVSIAPWISGLAHSDKAQPFSGDFNGDGLIDFGVFNDGDWSFTVSTGRKFIAQTEWNLTFGADKTPVVSDFNSDGLTDIGIFAKDSGLWQVYHSTGDGFVSAGDWLDSFGQGEYNTAYALDFNGDGLTDAAVFDNSSFMWQRLAAQGEVSDLLQKITNSLGGTTEIAYKSSVDYDNTGGDGLSDLPFAMQTVSQVLQGDGLGNFYQTGYSYANGLYAADERETRGFGYVRVADAEGNISENYFHQDNIFKGLPYKNQIKNASGNLYLETLKTYDYATPYSGSTFVYLTQEEASSYEGGISPKTVRTGYEYDDYGNPTKVTNLGDVEITGDEKESNIEYVYNLDLWILGLPCHTYLKDSAGEIVSRKWLYYDEHQSYTDSPTKGDLTKEEAWLDTPDKTNPTTQSAYDGYGNVISTIDARNKMSTVAYDATSTYPETVTNHLGHIIQNTYDLKTGQILTSTDPNGQLTRNVYDIFGRISQVFGPNDDVLHPSTWYEYDLSTAPAKIGVYTREEYNTDDANKIRTAFSFVDGLGRTIQAKTEADEPAKQIISGIVSFNSRGKVEHKYLPYLADKTTAYASPDLSQPKATYSYDCLGRTVKVINPDSTFSAVAHSPGMVRGTDENGHSINKYQDAYGQTVKVEEFNHGKIYTTIYQYDAQGNLTQTTDDQGNVTAIEYDSLGRKTSMDDPDMGVWSYDYDANGNLIKQTGAKGQSIEFEYDALNRLAKKWGLSPQGTVPIFSVDYLYDDTEKANCIGRLSKISDSSGQTEFFYDNLGREIKTIKTVDGVEYKVERSYDALNRLTSLTYPDGEIVTYAYTASGGIKTVSGSETYVSDVTYSASGQMSKITYGNNTYTNYTYDSRTLRLKRLTTNDGSLQDLEYQFDNVGNITTINDNRYTATQSFAYDDLSRLTSAIGRASYGSKTYRYDSIGNILEKDGITYAYGENGAGPHAVTSLTNLTSETNLTYDSNGNMVSKGDATFAYDIENRLISATSSLRGNEVAEAISFDLSLSPGWNFIATPFKAVEMDGALTPIEEVPLSNPSNPLLSLLGQIEGKYDQVSRYNSTTQQFESFINNPKFDQFDSFDFGEGYMIYVNEACSLSLTGQLANSQTRQLKSGWNIISVPSITEISALEALNNLEEGVDYDRIVRYNKSTQLFENISADGLLTAGEAYYLHCLQDVAWDIPQNARQTTEFAYDGDGGRVKKALSLRGASAASDEAISTTTYIGSLYEIDSDGTTRNHIFLGSTRIATASLRVGEANAAISYYHSDHLGSSNVITDQSGQLVQYLEYLPFGQTQVSTGADTVHHKFTGKELDPSTGLYYYGARYYDAQLGRFISADSIVQAPYDPQSLNRYTYCRNNPVKYVDPTGHFWWVIPAIIGAIVGGVSAHQAGGNVLKGALIGAVIGVATAALAAGAVASLNSMALASGATITAAENALITGAEFAIGGFGAGLVSGFAGGEGSASDMFKSAGIGAGFGFVTGAAVGYSYQAGWQSFLHGNDSRAINHVYREASLSLKSGNFARYAKASRELMKYGIKPPSGVSVGYSTIKGNVEHTFLVAVKEGSLKARGWDAVPQLKKFAGTGFKVTGMVRNEGANLLTASNFRFLTSDLSKVKAVWVNMDKVVLPYYQVQNPTLNCYGWRNAVLSESGISPPNDLPWIN